MKQNNKGFGATSLLLILVVVGLVVATGFYVWQTQNKGSSPTAQQTTENQTIQVMVAGIKSRVSSEVPAVEETGAEEGNYNGYVHYQADGYDYLSGVETDTLVNYQPKQPATSETEDEDAAAKQQDELTLVPVKAIITEALAKNGFTLVSDYPTQEVIGEGALYQTASDVCALNTGYAVGISCAAKEEFKKEAKEVKPFVDVLRSDGDFEEVAGHSFSVLDMGTGETKDDKYAIVSIGIGAANFYEKNGEWVYLGTTMHGIGCSEIENNPEAARAFAGNCQKDGEGL